MAKGRYIAFMDADDALEEKALSTLFQAAVRTGAQITSCLLYTSDAADDLIGVDLGGRRIIKKKIFSSRRRHTRCLRVSWARRCV